MCWCCEQLCERLSKCFGRKKDVVKPDKKSKKDKKKLSETMRSSNRSDQTTPVKHKRRKKDWGKRLSEMTDEELLKPIKLPVDDISDPLEYMKRDGFEIIADQFIDSGTYGEVYKSHQIEDNGNKKLIACKVIKVRDSKRREKMIETMRRELYFLEKLTFHYIIKTIKHFVFECVPQNGIQEINAFVFMEFATEGNLEDELEKRGPFDNDLAKKYFAEIASGVKCMHNHSIAHRDLKLENILLVNSPVAGLKDCKISDFGLSQIVYKEGIGFIKSENYLGTRPYMAPEVLRLRVRLNKGLPKTEEDQYDPMPVDCWALGVIAYRLLTKEFPFELTDRSSNLIPKVLNDQKKKNWSFPKTLNIDVMAKDLITKCLEPNITKRINITGIISHPWLEGEASLTEATVTQTR